MNHPAKSCEVFCVMPDLIRHPARFWIPASAGMTARGGKEMSWERKYFPEYWDGKKLAYPHVPKESPKFARSIIAGNLIFVSGCTGQDTITGKPTAGTFEEQMIMALDKVGMAIPLCQYK